MTGENTGFSTNIQSLTGFKSYILLRLPCNKTLKNRIRNIFSIFVRLIDDAYVG
jgi:hypothetical protein